MMYQALDDPMQVPILSLEFQQRMSCESKGCIYSGNDFNKTCKQNQAVWSILRSIRLVVFRFLALVFHILPLVSCTNIALSDIVESNQFANPIDAFRFTMSFI